MKPLGKNILRLIKERHLSVPKLAAAADMDKGNLYRIIQEGTGYSQASLDRIAAALYCNLGELFSEVGSGMPPGMRRIPILDGKQVAAFTSGVLEPPNGGFPEFAMSCATCSSQAFAMYVTGGSMVPDFHSGDLVVIDPVAKPQPGQFVVALFNDEAIIRKYAQRGFGVNGEEVFELLPSNFAFPNLRSDQHPLRILGVARQRVLELP